MREEHVVSLQRTDACQGLVLLKAAASESYVLTPKTTELRTKLCSFVKPEPPEAQGAAGPENNHPYIGVKISQINLLKVLKLLRLKE